VRRYEYWYRWCYRLTGGIGDANRHTSADIGGGARGAGTKRGHDGDDPGRGIE
jgi:hypothetical protein